MQTYLEDFCGARENRHSRRCANGRSCAFFGQLQRLFIRESDLFRKRGWICATGDGCANIRAEIKAEKGGERSGVERECKQGFFLDASFDATVEFEISSVRIIVPIAERSLCEKTRSV